MRQAGKRRGEGSEEIRTVLSMPRKGFTQKNDGESRTMNNDGKTRTTAANQEEFFLVFFFERVARGVAGGAGQTVDFD